jgi:transaldolase
MASIEHLLECGQSLWLDYVDRDLLTQGGLKRMIDMGVCGVTSNPSIFHQAITSTQAYDDAIRDLIQADPAVDAETVYEWLAVQDVQQACDQLQPVFKSTKGDDGFVSLEVSPRLANDAAGTIAQARHLWRAVGRDNVMIKVPGTEAGLEAIEDLIAEGIHVNVTLLFSVERYEQVFDAYTRGLARNEDPRYVRSVASFFVSRIDNAVDAQLAEAGPDAEARRHCAAIANAKVAYEAFQRMRHSDAFDAQSKRGAHVQRPLWASTSAKDPDLPPTIYIDRLIGPATVNTVPPETLDAFVTQGSAAVTIDDDMESAHATLRALPRHGIDMAAVARQLETEGIQKFIDAHDALIAALDDKLRQVSARYAQQ